MKTKLTLIGTIMLIMVSMAGFGQFTPHYQYTLLQGEEMDEIIGEISGETAFNHILEMAAYNRNRPASEYSTTL